MKNFILPLLFAAAACSTVAEAPGAPGDTAAAESYRALGQEPDWDM